MKMLDAGEMLPKILADADGRFKDSISDKEVTNT
jgi:hypothetical protein